MQTEIEVKFLRVDVEDVRKRLAAQGARLVQSMRLMRRVVLDFPDRRMQVQGDSWVRVRDEGDKVTLTYKQTTEHEFGGAKEIEVVVSDYEKTIAIFQQLGLVIHTDQETRRETWHLGDVEVVIDEWPWLQPFVEIEGATKQSIQDAAAALGFDWNEAVFGSVISAYQAEYPSVDDIGPKISKEPEVKFNLPQPTWLQKGKQ